MKMLKPIQYFEIIVGRKETRLVMLLSTMFLLVVMGACAPAAGQVKPTVEFATTASPANLEFIPPKGKPQKSGECPALDSQLFQLTQEQDAAQLAAQLGFRVIENKVQVLLVLKSEDLAFLTDFGADVGTQSGNQVQAFVPFDQLCALSKNDFVLAVRSPAQAIP